MEYTVFMISIVSLFTGLFIAGLRGITADGMIGYPIRQFFQKNHPVMGKPIVLCTWCMASFWGTICYWSFNALNLRGLTDLATLDLLILFLGWPFCMCIISYIGGILWLIKEKME